MTPENLEVFGGGLVLLGLLLVVLGAAVLTVV